MAFDIQARAAIGGPAPDDVQLVLNTPTLQEILGDIVSANLGTNLPGPFFNCTFGLYQNGLIPDENTTFEELIECNFPGYSRSDALTFSGVGLDDQGNIVVVADVPDAFQCTGDPDSQQVRGCYIATAGDANVTLGAAALADAIDLANGTLIPATLTVQIGNS